MSLFCMSFLFCVFRTTHLPQKAQTNSGYVGRSDRDLETLFEVLLGFVCFLKKNVLQKILLFFFVRVRVSTGSRGDKHLMAQCNFGVCFGMKVQPFTMSVFCM